MIIKKILISLVKLYQKALSPDHSFWAKAMNKPPYCKHIPSCSEYMIEAIEKKGVIIGITKGIGRILRCMPWGKGGYDPVEKKK
ncbi:membrane protein insertion efficiency factor YidD [Candidatus Gracilibacteria bacterium]|nr:membrane protein insertion efficiency factor YidD [Candidatus Gracilibacteria bacterium]NUJ98809.1 membrane protein insertion efficiency factor YidD [Candidatus Gracilibacteria bacterium]